MAGILAGRDGEVGPDPREKALAKMQMSGQYLWGKEDGHKHNGQQDHGEDILRFVGRKFLPNKFTNRK